MAHVLGTELSKEAEEQLFAENLKKLLEELRNMATEYDHPCLQLQNLPKADATDREIVEWLRKSFPQIVHELARLSGAQGKLSKKKTI